MIANVCFYAAACAAFDDFIFHSPYSASLACPNQGVFRGFMPYFRSAPLDGNRAPIYRKVSQTYVIS